MSRAVVGLKFAQACERPKGLPSPRAKKGSKGYGLRYERAVAQWTGGQHGQWFYFVDANGEGWCQTDVLLGLDGGLVVLECKLTEVEEARRQLGRLYLPVVERAMKKPVRGIVVARHLTKETELANVVTSMGQALKVATSEYFPTLHWIGRGPI